MFLWMNLCRCLFQCSLYGWSPELVVLLLAWGPHHFHLLPNSLFQLLHNTTHFSCIKSTKPTWTLNFELWTLNMNYDIAARTRTRRCEKTVTWETCNELMKEHDRFQGLLFRKDFRLLNLLWVGSVRFLFGLPTLFNKIEVLDMVSLVDIFGKILL